MDIVLLGVRLSVDDVTLYNHLDPQLMSYINIVTHLHCPPTLCKAIECTVRAAAIMTMVV